MDKKKYEGLTLQKLETAMASYLKEKSIEGEVTLFPEIEILETKTTFSATICTSSSRLTTGKEGLRNLLQDQFPSKYLRIKYNGKVLTAEEIDKLRKELL